MPISLDEVKHVAKLARLELGEAELLAFQGELNALLGHFEDIAQIDTEGLAPKPHAVALRNVLGEDVVQPSLPRESVLANAKSARAGLFIVPAILED